MAENGPFGTPFFDPTIPPKRFVGPFLRLSQDMRAHSTFFWGPKSGILGGGQKVYVLFLSPNLGSALAFNTSVGKKQHLHLAEASFLVDFRKSAHKAAEANCTLSIVAISCTPYKIQNPIWAPTYASKYTPNPPRSQKRLKQNYMKSPIFKAFGFCLVFWFWRQVEGVSWGAFFFEAQKGFCVWYGALETATL